MYIEASPSVLIKAINKQIPIPAPLRASIQITDLCNLHCEYCLQHSYLKKPYNGYGHVPVARVRSIVKELAEMGTKEICLLGQGEPSMHPDFPDIVRIVKKAGMVLSIYTNLSGTASRVRLAYAMADRLLVNLSASDELSYGVVHASASSRAFRQVLKNLLYLKDRAGCRQLPGVNISFVVTKDNFSQLDKMFEIGRKYGVQLIQFNNPLLVPETRALALGAKERKEFIRSLIGLTAKFPDVRTNAREVMSELLSSGKKSVSFNRCFMGWLTLSVELKGRVILCSRNRKLDVGQWKEGGMQKLWTGKRAQRYRRLAQDELKQTRLFGKECQYCSHAAVNAYIESVLYPKSLKGVKNRILL